MKRHLKLLVGTLTLLSLALGGCGAQEEELYGGEEARSDKQRLASPVVPASDLQAQVKGNTTFAFELYQRLCGDPGNLFFSPHSISLALAMTHAGAKNTTEKQMEQVLSFLPQAKLHPALNKLDLELAKRGQGAKGADGSPFRLNVVNATWGQRGYAFLPGYLDTLALNYGAGLRLLDFAEQPEPSRKTINGWVEQKTEQRIKDLIPSGTITNATRLVLTNAIYFNASWDKPFKPEMTKTEPFTTLAGAQVKVPMMNGSFGASYTRGTDFTAAALPYDGHELSMLIIVPEAGKFDSFEKALTAAKLDQIIKGLAAAQLTIKLPRFGFTKPIKLAKTLTAMGMIDAFSGEADFSGIDGSRSLFISEVLHKAFVKVDENGTEAAAATAVVMPGSGPPQPETLLADRPFIFLIRDHATGAVLFVGRVVDPS
jgi:serine protease inhibitor